MKPLQAGRQTTIRIALFVGVAMLALSNIAPAAQPSVTEINQLLAAGKTQQATKSLRAWDDAIKTGEAADDIDLTFPLAIAARAHEQAKQIEDAVELYQRSLAASSRAAAADLPSEKLVMIRLAASATLVQAAQYAPAIDALALVLSDEAVADAQRKIAIGLVLHVGSEALAVNQPALATRAYQLAVDHATGNLHATAMLGAGWAAALEKKDPALAAKKLWAFVDTYPDHRDALRAAALRVTCFHQANLPTKAAAALVDLLDRWPDSLAATAAIGQFSPRGPTPPEVEKWLLRQAVSSDLRAFTPAVTALGLLAAARADDETAWTELSRHLAAVDDVGQATSDVLQKLTAAKLDAHAQRLAAALIAATDQLTANAANREAACRWAGRNELWSMLALASESSAPETDDPTRSVSTERLFAEALMQTGRPADAHVWWQHLVDTRGVHDFATLLRCAETATSLSDVQQAGKRIDAARQSAAEQPAQVALVEMLSAELSIRKLDFAAARSTLENIVQASQAVAPLRARAQWLIGETFLMQRKFADAIEAYRRVEGIDPDGPWVAAALVQAGKAFEQLGRTREAAVCYSSLVGRFADSQYAGAARKRLAEIAPLSNDPDSPNPSSGNTETIRR